MRPTRRQVAAANGQVGRSTQANCIVPVYPPLKLLIGSVTTSAAICAGGLALMGLPTLLAGLWFMAHQHGRLRGFGDANKDGGG